MTSERSFAQEPQSIADARQFVAETISGTPEEVSERALVMVSELATNAIRHAGTDFVVRVESTDEEICVEITDEGPGEPVMRSAAPLARSGRGLRIVDALADAWGVRREQTAPGKTVWFSISLAVTSARREATLEVLDKARRGSSSIAK